MTGICDSRACYRKEYITGKSDLSLINCYFQITGGDPGAVVYGEGVADPVLQVNKVQAQQDHSVSGWCERGTVPDRAPA